MARDPHLNCNIFRKWPPVDHQHRHLVFGIKPQIIRRVLLRLAQIDCPHLELRVGFGERNVGNERASIWRVVEDDFH